MFDAAAAWDALVGGGDDIAIFTHPNPDGDAIGSALGLALALDSVGKRPIVILESLPQRFQFMPGLEFIGNTIPPDALTISVDCGARDRAVGAENISLAVNIDHHISNDNFAQNNFVDAAAASTCELIYRIINNHVKITADIATALYAGIVTDTGGFRHGSTTPETHQIAAALMQTGINHADIALRALYGRSITNAKTLGLCIQNMAGVAGYPILYSTISLAEIEKVGAKSDDFSGLADFLRNIDGTDVAVSFCQTAKGLVKCNLRSIHTDVNAIAQDFGGGGHFNAAGIHIGGEIAQVAADVLNRIKQEIDKK